jgi:Zn-finger nucleic acid-binding protein
MTVLSCPVCQGEMREVNKHGVLVDTCTQCRGVWLDRGELEKLIGLAEPSADTQGRARGLIRDSDDDRAFAKRGSGLRR